MWRHFVEKIFVEEYLWRNIQRKFKIIICCHVVTVKTVKLQLGEIFNACLCSSQLDSPLSDKLNFILVQSWSLYFCLAVKADNILAFSVYQSFHVIISALKYILWKVSGAACPISSGPFPQKPPALNLNNLATAVCKTQPKNTLVIQIQIQIQKDEATLLNLKNIATT